MELVEPVVPVVPVEPVEKERTLPLVAVMLEKATEAKPGPARDRQEHPSCNHVSLGEIFRIHSARPLDLAEDQ